jgi:hypothetical protein
VIIFYGEWFDSGDGVGQCPAEWWGLRVDLRCLRAAVDRGGGVSIACSMLIAAEIQRSLTGNRQGWSSAERELMPH